MRNSVSSHSQIPKVWPVTEADLNRRWNELGLSKESIPLPLTLPGTGHNLNHVTVKSLCHCATSPWTSQLPPAIVCLTSWGTLIMWGFKRTWINKATTCPERCEKEKLLQYTLATALWGIQHFKFMLKPTGVEHGSAPGKKIVFLSCDKSTGEQTLLINAFYCSSILYHTYGHRRMSWFKPRL